MRYIRRIVLALLCVLLLTCAVSAVDNEIRSVTTEISVDENGRCNVTTTAQVHFTSSPTTFSFPLNTSAGSISASGADYKISTKNGVAYAVFSDASGFSGDHTFTCSYKLPCAATKIEGEEEDEFLQQFLLNVIDGGWEYSILKYSLRMTFPVDVPVQPTWNSAFHGDIIDNSLTIKVSGKMLTVNSVQTLIDHETLEMSLLFPDNTFTIINQAGRTMSVTQIAFFVLLAAAIVYWFIFLRGKLLLLAARRPLPGNDATAGEIPCQLFGEKPDIAAMLAHWGNLGYLTVHRSRNGRILLRKQMDMGNERSAAECRLFQAIFRSGSSCDALGKRFRAVCRTNSDAIRKSWLHRIFRKKAGSPYLLRAIVLFAAFFLSMATFDQLLPANTLRWFLLPLTSVLGVLLCAVVQFAVDAIYRRHRLLRLICGLISLTLLIVFSAIGQTLALMIVNLLMQLLSVLLTQFGGRRTKAGEEYVRQIIGLRRYLYKMDPEDALQIVHNDSQYFYRMLPYAECLGIGKHFCKHFARWKIEPCAWLTDAAFTPKSPTEFLALYENLMNSIRNEPNSIVSGLQTVTGRV